ncbi:tetratricopeptide repeat protein, partial [bacterium]|nr:tetratricopeptide repeat protein [bacterium]
HRDLKPANIMIVEEATGLASRQCSAFVLDFGLASIRDSGTRVTKTGMSMGTPAYMPPEQASGEPADERSDVYSLGATLYHVLTGRPPFAGSSDVNLVVAVLTKDPTPPGRVNPRAAGDLETIAMKCLEKEPEKRYESAAALADDLDRHLRGEPISARPLGPLARLARRARRNKAITALLALLLLTVAGGAGALAQARARAEARLVHEARDRALRASADLELRRKSSRGAATQGFQDLLALALASYEAALSYADHARSDEARATAFDAAIALGDVALEGEQWSLASSAYSRARSLGVDAARDDRAAKALGQVEARRVAVQQSHRQVVLETIATVGSTKPLYDHDAALFTLVRLSEPQTVRLLGEELDRITALLQRAKRDVYLAAAEPDADEARNGVRPIDGLAAAIDDSLALSPGTEPARAVAEILKEAEERLLARQGRAGYRTPVATLVATSQERALGEARIQVAKLLCEALGWIGTKEGAIGPLSRYLEAENDEQRAIPAGMALCQLADVEAVRIATVSRHYAGSSYQTQVRRVVDRLGTRTSVDASSVTDLCARSRSRFELGDFPGALADATRALELDPRCGRAWQLRGAARDRTGDVDGAIADLPRAAELAPNALVFMNRGQALGQKGDTDAAIEDFSRAISLDPGLAHAWYNRGVARQRKRDLEGALADASRALELDPRSVEALVLRAECRSLAQDQDGALADLAQATAIDPRHSPAWVLRGRLRRLRNDLDGALADMTRAIELDPKDAAAWGERGIVRREKHDHEGAIADFTRALELRPDDVDGLDSRADSYFRLGKNEAAIADLDRAVKVAPGDAATWEHRGRSRAEIGDTEGALADLARAIELAPRRPDAWNTRGIVKDSYLRDLEGAIADFTRAIELDPRFSQAHEGRAWARFRAGEYDLAIADATRAIEIAPSRASARVVRGGARSNKGELELAIADLARATELDPRGAEAFDFLGNTLVRHGDSGRALEAFTRALELDPRMADAWRGRGVLKRDVLHDEKGAASDLARYVELRPDAKDADAWRAEIRKLRGE